MKEFFKKKDIIIIGAVVLVIVIAAVVVLLTGSGGGTKAHLAIYVGDMLYREVELDEEKTVTVNQGQGVINKVHVTKNGFYMESSSCDNQDCVHQGEVTLDNYEDRVLMNWIVCLPNQVTLELVVEDDDANTVDNWADTGYEEEE